MNIGKDWRGIGEEEKRRREEEEDWERRGGEDRWEGNGMRGRRGRV